MRRPPLVTPPWTPSLARRVGRSLLRLHHRVHKRREGKERPERRAASRRALVPHRGRSFLLTDPADGARRCPAAKSGPCGARSAARIAEAMST
eukprot:10295857-Alexandrium_andersonii.AAC.1